MFVPLLIVKFGESILEVVIKREGSSAQKWVLFSLVPSVEVSWFSHRWVWWGFCGFCIWDLN